MIPPELSKSQAAIVYASEADVLNVALFGNTAKQWRDKNPDNDGNIRDYADVSQLVCLANLETLNAHLIHQEFGSSDRLFLLNKTAIEQMKILISDTRVKGLETEKI